MYDEVRITDSTLLRFVREKITNEYGLTPENWLYFEMALILASFSLIMQFHKFTNMLLIVVLFMAGERMLMCCCVAALILKGIYYLFRNQPAVNEYYVDYNENHKHSDVGLIGFSMMLGLLAAGLVMSNWLPVHMIWGTILFALLMVLMYTFPAVVQKSAASGFGYMMIIGIVLGCIALTTTQINLPKWMGEQALRWKYPHADLTEYIMGYVRVDEAKMAHDLAQEASKLPEGFLVDSTPMVWSQAINTRVVAEPTKAYGVQRKGVL